MFLEQLIEAVNSAEGLPALDSLWNTFVDSADAKIRTHLAAAFKADLSKELEVRHRSVSMDGDLYGSLLLRRFSSQPRKWKWFGSGGQMRHLVAMRPTLRASLRESLERAPSWSPLIFSSFFWIYLTITPS